MFAKRQLVLFAAIGMLAACSKEAPSTPAQANAPQVAASAPLAVISASDVSSQPPPATPGQNVPPPQPEPEPAATVAPPAPAHLFGYEEDGRYGYDVALNDDDRKQGIVTKPLAMFRYLGKVDDKYIIESVPSNSVAQRYACAAPCEYVKAITVNAYGGMKTEVLHLPPNALLSAPLADAMTGQLKPTRSPVDQLFPADWRPRPPVTQQTVPKPVAMNNADQASPAPATQLVDGVASSAAVIAIQPSFDCTKARSDAEHLICSDATLATLDKNLADTFARAKAAAKDPAAFKEHTRTQWNYREQSCHDRDCLLRWYQDQKTALEQIATTGDVQ